MIRNRIPPTYPALARYTEIQFHKKRPNKGQSTRGHINTTARIYLQTYSNVDTVELRVQLEKHLEGLPARVTPIVHEIPTVVIDVSKLVEEAIEELRKMEVKP